tara:strand:- start:41 stop:418 length:378 start_codon:yes stop_codon:yes gene_type:complete
MEDKTPYKEMKIFVDAFSYQDWEEAAPTSVNRAKEQIAKCLLFFMKDIYNEVWYHGWNEPSQKKFDKAAQEMFNHLTRFVKSGNFQTPSKKTEEKTLPTAGELSTFQEEELELGDIKTLRDYLVN